MNSRSEAAGLFAKLSDPDFKLNPELLRRDEKKRTKKGLN